MISKREHDAMLRVKQDAGWRYGPVYDEAQKTDPGMVAYEQLTFEDGEPVQVPVEEVVDDEVEPVLVPVPEDVMQELSDIGQVVENTPAPQEGEFNG